MDTYAAYHIKKLRRYLLIMIGVSIVMSIVGEIVNPAGLSDDPMFYMNDDNIEWTNIILGENHEASLIVFIANFAVAYAVAVYFIRKWSKKWNESFTN